MPQLSAERVFLCSRPTWKSLP
uniref:Uncharacterized protein n=1 Tax=Anguilla anguilla TaxID=7936 RepID=A0A0E9QCP0_ANGAN